MEDSRADRDEAELQELLEKTPDPATVQCTFCENLSHAYVDSALLGLDDIEGEIPVCLDCWPNNDEGCMDCLLLNFCAEHMTREEHAMLLNLRELIESDDDDDDEFFD